MFSHVVGKGELSLKFYTSQTVNWAKLSAISFSPDNSKFWNVVSISPVLAESSCDGFLACITASVAFKAVALFPLKWKLWFGTTVMKLERRCFLVGQTVNFICFFGLHLTEGSDYAGETSRHEKSVFLNFIGHLASTLDISKILNFPKVSAGSFFLPEENLEQIIYLDSISDNTAHNFCPYLSLREFFKK